MKIIENIKVTHYRNLLHFNTNFSELSCFIGRNSIGKSNLLNAINLIQKTRIPDNSKNIGKNFSESQSITFECNLWDENLPKFSQYGINHYFLPGKYI